MVAANPSLVSVIALMLPVLGCHAVAGLDDYQLGDDGGGGAMSGGAGGTGPGGSPAGSGGSGATGGVGGDPQGGAPVGGMGGVSCEDGCGLFACDETSGTCLETCESPTDCAPNGTCLAPGSCETCGTAATGAICDTATCATGCVGSLCKCTSSQCEVYCDDTSCVGPRVVLDTSERPVYVLCDETDCANTTFVCEGGFGCTVQCSGNPQACQGLTLECDPVGGPCRLNCHGEACKFANVECGGNECKLCDNSQLAPADAPTVSCNDSCNCDRDAPDCLLAPL